MCRDARSAYDAWHRGVQSGNAEADQPWHELLFSHLRPGDLTGRRVLEIGCGRGELARRIMAGQDRPSRYVAADFSDAAVRIARAGVRTTAERQAVHWLVADIGWLPLGESFDVAISCETIEHLADPVAALREIRRVLRPGGLLFLTTPNYLGMLGLYRGYLRLRGRRYTEGGQPICRFTWLLRTWWWLRRAGWRVRVIDAVGHYVLRPGRPQRRSAVLDRFGRWLWPIGLHSLVVAEKPRA